MIEKIRAASSAPGFWDDSEAAQRQMQELARLEAVVSPWQEVRRRLDDVHVLVELAQEEADPAAYEGDLQAELAAVRERLGEMELADVTPMSVVTRLLESTQVEIDPQDVRIDTLCSIGGCDHSGQGEGCAVRLTHLPTGIVVCCQNERSHLKNKQFAWTVLCGRLAEIQSRKADAQMTALRAESSGN